jgi:hypothetical protein
MNALRRGILVAKKKNGISAAKAKRGNGVKTGCIIELNGGRQSEYANPHRSGIQKRFAPPQYAAVFIKITCST